MKKFLAFLLSMALTFSLCACGNEKEIEVQKEVEVQTETVKKTIYECNSLDEILNNGFKINNGTYIYDNLYVPTIFDNSNREYKAVIKVKDEQRNSFDEIDFFEDDSIEKYVALLGNNEIIDILDVYAFLPSSDMLDMYKGMVVAEFENTGAYLTGYSGIDGEYSFNFSDDMCDYTVKLENKKLKDYEGMDEFENAIQNEKIENVTCDSLSSVFLDNYLQQFFDEPQKASPKQMGESFSTLDEINKLAKTNIKPITNASEETFSVIDSNISQYIYKLNDIYYCIRASKDMQIDLTDDSFNYGPIADENGFVTLSFMQSDETKSVRFVFDDCQYAYIVYDNDSLDYEVFNTQQEEYRNSIYEYKKDSVFNKVLGTFVSGSEYMMSVIPISNLEVQFTVANYNSTKTKLYTMIAEYNDGKFTYDKSRVEEYSNGNYTTENASGGVITLKSDTLVWNNITFTK